MILLGIDTCGSTGTLALAHAAAGEWTLLGSAELAGRTTAAELVPALKQMLAQARVGLGAVEGIVVVDGPGSFTGIRIGLSTAKGLAEARTLPVFAISRLRVLASAHGCAAAALDAGRGEFYFGRYAGEALGVDLPVDASEAGQVLGEWLLTQQELASRLIRDDAALVVCEQKLAGLLAQAQLVSPPGAAEAIHAALPAVLAGKCSLVPELDGRYLRRSDLYRTSVAPVT